LAASVGDPRVVDVLGSVGEIAEQMGLRQGRQDQIDDGGRLSLDCWD